MKGGGARGCRGREEGRDLKFLNRLVLLDNRRLLPQPRLETNSYNDCLPLIVTGFITFFTSFRLGKVCLDIPGVGHRRILQTSHTSKRRLPASTYWLDGYQLPQDCDLKGLEHKEKISCFL
jgi:hypothetical protein